MLYLISREAKIFAGVCLTIPADCFACFYVKNPWAISFVIEVKWHNPKTATTTLNDQYMGMSAMVLKQWWDMVFKFVSFQSTPSWYLGIPETNLNQLLTDEVILDPPYDWRSHYLDIWRL